MVTLHEVITFLVSMQISISSLQTHNVNRCGRSRHLARKLSLRRKRSSPNVFEMAATETITSIILIKLIRVSLGTVRHPRRFKIVVIDIQITLKQMLRDFIGIRVNRAKKSGMVNITSSVNSRERSGINTILHGLTPLFTINETMRDIKSKNVYSRVNSKATTQWRKTESSNGVYLEGVASDNRSSLNGNKTTNLTSKEAKMGKVMRHTLGASLNIRHNLASSKGPKPLQLKFLTTYIPKTIAFFFQAEDGIRHHWVTGVQTCALPILTPPGSAPSARRMPSSLRRRATTNAITPRSEERRVGKECRSRWPPYH